MGLSADTLREGQTIAVRCVGGVDRNQFLQGRSGGGVGLTASLDDQGAQWEVHETANRGIFSFESVGNGFLEGRKTIHGFGHAPPGDFVGLVPGIQNLITSWKVLDIPNPDKVGNVVVGFNHVMLQCQAELQFLTGQPNAGSVRLFPENSASASTHWELIPLPVGTGGSGPGGPNGKPQ